jgi:hypothetical protein
MGSNWDTEKFTDSNDYGLWKVKMQEVLTQHNFALLKFNKNANLVILLFTPPF